MLGSKDEIARLLAEFDKKGASLPLWAMRLISGLRHEWKISQAENKKLRSACRGAFKLPRPWLDTFSGRKGTLTFEEWDSTISAIESAIEGMGTDEAEA